MSMMTSVCDSKWRRLVMVSDYMDDGDDVYIWWRCQMVMSGGDEGENVLNYDMENDVVDVDDADDDDVRWLCLMTWMVTQLMALMMT